MGGKRSLVLGRCAALLFLCGAAASLPTNALLGAHGGAWAVDGLALISACVCALIPWDRIDGRWLHLLVLVATAEVVLAVVVHARHAMVFTWYFALVAVFAAYAFRRRAEVAIHLGTCALGMAASAAYAAHLAPDAPASAFVGIPTIVVAAGVVVWLREGLELRERTDPLTGLGNRRALMEALQDVFDRRRERVLVLFDLDGFKRYNDHLGHAAGDALLETFGERLAAAVAGHGSAFRLGGDELCVLLPDDALVGACAAALEADGIRASYGAARLPAEAGDPGEALGVADARMYAAKRSGRELPFVVTTESDSPTPPPTAPRRASRAR